MKMLGRTLWQELKQSINGLADVRGVTKATLVMEGSKPAMLHLEMLVDKKSEGRLLTKTYELVEIGTDETGAFLSENENGLVETTDLSSESRTWAKLGGYR